MFTKNGLQFIQSRHNDKPGLTLTVDKAIDPDVYELMEANNAPQIAKTLLIKHKKYNQNAAKFNMASAIYK